jgi:zinc protease
LKVAFHAPAFGESGFFPLLVLDAALTGAKGLSLWSSYRGLPPQRRSRLYRALVERGLASSVGGAVLPTEHPFLYTVSVTATDGTALVGVTDVLLEELERVRVEGITDAELLKAKTQLKARLVFDNESIADIAHQLGYFETIASVDSFLDAPSRIAAVTLDEVSKVAQAVLAPFNRTIGTFEPAAT